MVLVFVVLLEEYTDMGLFGKKKSEPRVGNHEGNNEYLQEVVGEKSYRENLVKIIKSANAQEKGEIFTKAFLILEPKNDFDAKAIAVQIDGLKVGYIPRTETAEFHKVFNQYKLDAMQVKARIGWDVNNPEPMIGVQLDVYWED